MAAFLRIGRPNVTATGGRIAPDSPAGSAGIGILSSLLPVFSPFKILPSVLVFLMLKFLSTRKYLIHFYTKFSAVSSRRYNTPCSFYLYSSSDISVLIIFQALLLSAFVAPELDTRMYHHQQHHTLHHAMLRIVFLYYSGYHSII